MRQIQFCAWLWLMPLAATACSGEAFTAGDSSPTNDTPAETSGGTPSRNHAGSGGSSSGMVQLGSGGKSSAAGAATGGAAFVGGTASGGMSSAAGGNAGGSGNSSGGGYDESCPSGAITFRMLPSPDLEKNFLCDAGCGTGWLTITDPEGATAFSIFSACGTASCESCEMLACAAAACLPTPLTAEGSDLVWTGTYLAKDTCGANMACQRQACVKPGRYKAKACAAINGGTNASGACTPKNEQLCAEAEFEFPATATVKLLLKK
jgi:hypothetical protein